MEINLNGSDWTITGLVKNQWRLTRSMETGAALPSAWGNIPSTVPGAIQLDLMQAGLLEDPDFGLNSLKGEWVNNREWICQKTFTLPEDLMAEHLVLSFKGLDYQGEIYLNRSKIAEFCGMFVPVEIDITGLVNRQGSNLLEVIFFQSPDLDGHYGYSNRLRHLKSRFNYTWDWCPRIVPVGIWDDVTIRTHDLARIVDFYPLARCESDGQGSIRIESEIDAAVSGDYLFTYDVTFAGQSVFQKKVTKSLLAARQTVTDVLAIGVVESWWPNGQGQQPLYDVSLTVEKTTLCDRAAKRIGFRDVQFVQNSQAPEGALPYTLVINDRSIFIRGINWVPISPFYGSVTEDQYRLNLQRFKDMNCNLLRVWGGAILEKQAFYDICDEMGLMVWQEFPQSSSGLNNTPPDDPGFLKDLEKVAISFIKQKRHHACHVVWCGGNELMWEDHTPLNDHHVNIKMLKDLVHQLDGQKFFLPTSASGPRFNAAPGDFGKGIHHDVHGPWTYLGPEDQYTYFNGDDSLLRSETGCPGMSRLETLERYKAEFPVWPPDTRNPYWVHRGAWWIQLAELTRLFGEWAEDGSEIAQYVRASRYIQAEALRYCAEATRRRQPVASGFIIWMGNEPFPNNSNTSVIEYDGTPKPCYPWIRRAFARCHASARYSKLFYADGELFTADLYLNSDILDGESDAHGADASADGFKSELRHLQAQILDINGTVLSETSWDFAILDSVTQVGSIKWRVDACDDDVFILRLRYQHDQGLIEDENTYVFTIGNGLSQAMISAPLMPLAPIRRLSARQLQLQKTGSGTWLIKNIDVKAAVNVFLYGRDPANDLQIWPNGFSMLPGEEKTLQITTSQVWVEDASALCIESW